MEGGDENRSGTRAGEGLSGLEGEMGWLLKSELLALIMNALQLLCEVLWLYFRPTEEREQVSLQSEESPSLPCPTSLLY